MKQGMDKWIDRAGLVAEGAARATSAIVSKGREKMDKMALNARLAKLHRQLGALVYMLHKNGEENQPMIQWYVGEIDRIKLKLAELDLPDTQPDFTVYGAPTPAEEGEEDAMFCGGGQL